MWLITWDMACGCLKFLKSQFVTISLLMKELSGFCVILVKVENVLK